MTTDKAIRANRANALKSTGPTSIIGKRKSARNAITHGLLASSIVLDGESTTRFYALINSLIDELQPTGPTEFALIENMAVARWRQMRIWGFQKAALTGEMRRHQTESAAENQPLDTHASAALAFRSLGESSRALDLMHRYETAYFRMFGRSMDRFKQHRARAAQQLPSEPVPPTPGTLVPDRIVNPEKSAESPQNGGPNFEKC